MAAEASYFGHGPSYYNGTASYGGNANAAASGAAASATTTTSTTSIQQAPGFWAHVGHAIVAALLTPLSGFWHSVVSTWHGILMFLAQLPNVIFAGILHNEITLAFQQVPWAQSMIGLCQGVAAALLCLRIIWELWRFGVSRAEGDPVDLGRIWRGSAYALAGIFVGPWLTLQLLTFGNDMVQAIIAILQAPVANPGALLQNMLDSGVLVVAGGALTPAGAGIVALIALVVVVLVIVILMIIIWVETMVRSIEILIAALMSPLAAIGFVSVDDGTAGVWWRQTVALVAAQVVQVAVLSIAMLLLETTTFPLWTRVGGCIGALIVAVRAPHVVQQYTYHTGVGGGTMQMVQQAATMAISTLL